jgi:hypothetical protein
LQQSGFALRVIQAHGQPRSRLLPLYLTALAQPVEGNNLPTIQAEHWVKRKRRYGLLHRRLLTRLFPRQAWLPVYAS